MSTPTSPDRPGAPRPPAPVAAAPAWGWGRDRRFTDQVAWITGAGTGLGAACAVELAARGAHVVLSGRRAEPLDEVAGRVRSFGRRALVLPLDVRDEDAQAAAVKAIVAEFGQLDVAVANAGYSVGGPTAELPAQAWRNQLEVNVIGLAITVRQALPALKARGGRIGLVGSVAAFLPVPMSGPYTASKAAVRMIGDTLSLELRGTGVSCTTLHPGFVESEIARVDNDGVHHPGRRDPRPARLMWKADDAARVMVDALHDRKRSFVFTGHGKLGAWMGGHLPGLTFAIMQAAGQRAVPRADRKLPGA
jgi:NAD(P)-dependent dehydrogenase (short-subunit alcohol dehydrogenase family)